jgi:4-hydroxybenzoate polyprenyltransferase
MISLIDSGSEVQTKSAGSSGTVSFELFEGTHDASGEHAGGNYSVRIVYGDYSSNQTLELGAHLLTFVVPIPWWYWHLIWGIVAIVVLLVTVTGVLVYRRRKSSK